MLSVWRDNRYDYSRTHLFLLLSFDSNINSKFRWKPPIWTTTFGRGNPFYLIKKKKPSIRSILKSFTQPSILQCFVFILRRDFCRGSPWMCCNCKALQCGCYQQYWGKPSKTRLWSENTWIEIWSCGYAISLWLWFWPFWTFICS